MRNINVPVEDAVYDAAKLATARAGMTFKRWVERAIADACEPPDSNAAATTRLHQTLKLREPSYSPVED